jgi:hypothetical protein
MPLIKTNFADVPNEIPTVSPDVYSGDIKSIEVRDFTVKTGKNAGQPGQSFDVAVVITTDGLFKGRTVVDGINSKMLTRLKQLALATGMSEAEIANGFQTEDLLGKSIKFRTKVEKYTPAGQSEQREIAKIADYFWKK